MRYPQSCQPKQILKGPDRNQRPTGADQLFRLQPPAKAAFVVSMNLPRGRRPRALSDVSPWQALLRVGPDDDASVSCHQQGQVVVEALDAKRLSFRFCGLLHLYGSSPGKAFPLALAPSARLACAGTGPHEASVLFVEP